MFQKTTSLRAALGMLLGIAVLAGCATPLPSEAAEPSPTPEPTLMEKPTESVSLPEETPTGASPVTIANPGFEVQAEGGMPPGWEITGTQGTALLEDNGNSGEYRLTHRGNQTYRVETTQTVSGLADDWYTLRVWVRSSGGQKESFAALVCGGEEQQVAIPSTMPGYRWLHLAVSNQVKGGQCTIRLFSEGEPDTWASFDDLELVRGRAALSIFGADISSLKKSEDLGGVYKYADGTQADALKILKDHGLNYARLRVWVNPADGYHDMAELLEMAARLKAQDIKLLVDFHYSDTWADPGKQIKPEAWKDLSFDQLKQAVYDHTFEVCNRLVQQGTPPDMVQVGNEINSGMLWPDGDYNHFDNLADLLKEGVRAVKDCSSDTVVMLHIAEGGDNSLARWWFDNITRRNVPFDVIGISYYPYWHGSLPELQANLDDISARYDKDVIVVETAYAFTNQDKDDYPNIASRELTVAGYPYTPEGQRAMLRDVLSVVRGVNGGRGLGVFYWDATWTAVKDNGWDPADPTSGNAWENQALFDYDSRLLPAMDEFRP